MTAPRVALFQASRAALFSQQTRSVSSLRSLSRRPLPLTVTPTMTGLHGILDKVIPHHHKDGSSSRPSSTTTSRPQSPVAGGKASIASSRKSLDSSRASSEIILK
jgi:hypothetical protein